VWDISYSSWTLLFNFALECAISKVQPNKEGLVNADGVHLLVKKHRYHTALSVAGNEAGQEVKAEKTKYTCMSHEQHASKTTTYRWVWWSSHNREELQQIQIAFMDKLRVDWTQQMPVTIQSRILCLPICYQKKHKDYTQNHNFACCFIWGWNLVSPIEDSSYLSVRHQGWGSMMRIESKEGIWT
jgi:hypothetical protein